MSYPLQPYNSNNGTLANQQFNRSMFHNNNRSGEDDLMSSIFGLANRLMAEILRNGPDLGGLTGIMGSDPFNPHAQVFGISAMNVTQISCGPDGRPHIVQAHDERRMGPGGIWQSKKALRDPDRGIDKMQVGYFVGDRGEIIERRLDPATGQYLQDVQQHGVTPNEPNFPHHRQMQSQPAAHRLPALPPQQYPYHSRQQQLPNRYTQQAQLPPYAPKPQQALPAPSSYQSSYQYL